MNFHIKSIMYEKPYFKNAEKKKNPEKLILKIDQNESIKCCLKKYLLFQFTLSV